MLIYSINLYACGVTKLFSDVVLQLLRFLFSKFVFTRTRTVFVVDSISVQTIQPFHSTPIQLL